MMDLLTKKENIAARRLGHHKDCQAERSDLVDKCYHGSVCIDASNDFGLLDKYCDCTAAEQLVAGLMCEHKATSICLDGDTEQVTDQFCVNGGLCKEFVGASESHPGCICLAGEWEGKHCEYHHGVALDDALDLFEQRKAEIANEMANAKLMAGGDLTAPTIKALGDSTEETYDETTGTKSFPVLLVVGSLVAVFAIINLAMFAIWKSRKRQRQVKDDSYASVGFGSVASLGASKSSLERPLNPPADVFLTSRKKEVESDDGNSFMMSPGMSPGQEHEQDVEVLDAETSRMIEAQFKNSEMNQDEEEAMSSDEEQEKGAIIAPSYESESDVSVHDLPDSGLLHSGRITVNSGKNPLSKIQSKPRPDAVITSLDGEYDDDSDGDNFFV